MIVLPESDVEPQILVALKTHHGFGRDIKQRYGPCLHCPRRTSCSTLRGRALLPTLERQRGALVYVVLFLMFSHISISI
jgi:hypothetical protein